MPSTRVHHTYKLSVESRKAAVCFSLIFDTFIPCFNSTISFIMHSNVGPHNRLLAPRHQSLVHTFNYISFLLTDLYNQKKSLVTNENITAKPKPHAAVLTRLDPRDPGCPTCIKGPAPPLLTRPSGPGQGSPIAVVSLVIVFQ